MVKQPASRSTDIDEQIIEPGNMVDVFVARRLRRVGVKATPIPGLPDRAYFLEDARAKSGQVYFSRGRTILALQASGEFLSYRIGMLGHQPVRCWTMNTGQHLLATRNGEMAVYDAEFNPLGRSQTPPTMEIWHGTFGLSESPAGTLCFGEYGHDPRVVRILRSIDGGHSWASVLELDAGRGRGFPVRHFHICVADPYDAGHWYASTGDLGPQNKLFHSIDDGATWQELLLAVDPRFLRFTACVVKPDRIVWATDDWFGGEGAQWVMLDKSTRKVRHLGRACDNEVRSIVRIADDLTLGISQSSDGQPYACLALMQGETVVPVPARIPALNTPSPFTISLGSREALDGVFYTFNDGRFFNSEARALRWQVSIDRSPYESLKPQLRTLIARRPREQNDRLVITEYARSRQCNMCNVDIRKHVHEGTFNPKWQRIERANIRTSDGVRVEYLCPHCNSRSRTRAIDVFQEKHMPLLTARGSGPGLLVSAPRQERELIRKFYPSIDHVSLQGDHGDPECRVGVDITALDTSYMGKYALIWAIGVLDYIEDMDLAIRRCAAALEPNGAFVFFLQPWRIIAGTSAPVVVDRNALSHEEYTRRPGHDTTGVPDIRVGRDWLRSELSRHFKETHEWTWTDPIGDVFQTIWWAQRPQ